MTEEERRLLVQAMRRMDRRRVIHDIGSLGWALIPWALIVAIIVLSARGVW